MNGLSGNSDDHKTIKTNDVKQFRVCVTILLEPLYDNLRDDKFIKISHKMYLHKNGTERCVRACVCFWIMNEVQPNQTNLIL